MQDTSDVPAYSQILLWQQIHHRTVIVTAAVHLGLGPQLLDVNTKSPEDLTYRHWAGFSFYISPCGFAETCVLVKQSLGNLLL